MMRFGGLAGYFLGDPEGIQRARGPGRQRAGGEELTGSEEVTQRSVSRAGTFFSLTGGKHEDSKASAGGFP